MLAQTHPVFLINYCERSQYLQKCETLSLENKQRVAAVPLAGQPAA